VVPAATKATCGRNWSLPCPSAPLPPMPDAAARLRDLPAPPEKVK